MSILDLSEEIIREIFHSSGNFLQCSLVCKRWNATALQMLYQEVNLNRERLHRTVEQLKLDPDERIGYFKYGQYVKKLRFRESSRDIMLDYDNPNNKEAKLTDKELISLLEHLPNIEELDLGRSLEVPSYQICILYMESEKCLNHLRILLPSPQTVSHTFSGTARYYRLAHKFRATIAETSLRCSDLEYDEESEPILTTLSQFKSLTHLTLSNAYDGDLTTLDILKACPTLIKLIYRSNKPIPEAAVKKLLDNPDYRNLGPNLKTFCISVPTLPLSYVKYIIDHLSPNVEYVALCFEEYLHDWTQKIGMDNALKLLSRLGAAKMATFSLKTFGDPRKREGRFSSRMTDFFSLVAAFKGKKEMYTHLRFKNFEDISYDPSAELLIDNSKDGLNLLYTLELDEYCISDGMGIGHGAFKAVLPNVGISKVGLNIVNNMEVFIRRSNPTMPYNFLQYAIQYCSNLTRFKFSYLQEPSESFSICTVPHPNKIKEKECLLSETPTKSMKVIRIVDRIPKKGVLKFFAACFRNIECLLLDCKYGIRDETPLTSNIDITSFQNLKTFGFYIDLVYEPFEYILVIHFIYTNGEEACYIVDEKTHKTKRILSLEMLEDWLDDYETSPGNIMTIRCRKDIKVIVGSSRGGVLAEFKDGKALNYVSITSNLLEKPEEDLCYM